MFIKKDKCAYAKRILIILFVLLSSIVTLGLSRTPPSHATRLVNLTFNPESGDYNINGTGQNLAYTNVKFYLLSVGLDKPAPGSFTITYDIKGDEFWSDPLLGQVQVRFNTGNTTPTSIRYINTLNGTRVPTGAPPVTEGKFWLGCTKKKILRGNAGKGQDGNAPVYLERSHTEFHGGTSNFTIGGGQGGRISSPHEITCI